MKKLITLASLILSLGLISILGSCAESRSVDTPIRKCGTTDAHIYTE